MMKYFVVVWYVIKSAFAAGAPCFTYEVLCHVNPGAAAGPAAAANNAAVNNYGNGLISVNHAPAVGVGALPATLITLGGGGVLAAGWAAPAPFAAPLVPMNLFNINGIINRRLAHGVQIAPSLLVKLAAVNAAVAAINPALANAAIPILIDSLRAGGYLNNTSRLLNSLTLGVFPLGTILGVPMPAFVPNSVIVHISLPERVSKNLNELSHSSLSTPLAAAVPVPPLTLKDRINAPYLIAGLPVPDSATVVSSDHLQ